MTYTFRVRFKIPPHNSIAHPEHELVLLHEESHRVVIRPLTADALVSDELAFALRGEGYESEADAQRQGQRWMAALALGSVAEFVPVDFGLRRLPSGLSDVALARMNAVAAGDHLIYSDGPGLHVVPSDPPPLWCELQAEGVANRNAFAVRDAIIRAYDTDLELGKSGALAEELFSAAESVSQEVDARFLTLMFAVEALIEVQGRTDSQLAALDAIRDYLIGMSDLSSEDREELKQALSRLRQESIGAAGRRLAGTLAPREYGGLSAVDFFRHAYGVRSKLVHGTTGHGRPSVSEVASLHGPMLWFIRDLVLATGKPRALPRPSDSPQAAA